MILFACPACGDKTERYGCRPGVCGAQRRLQAGIPIAPTTIASTRDEVPRSFAFEILGAPVPLARGRAFTDDSGKIRVRNPAKSNAYKKKIAAHVRATKPAAWPLDARYALELRVYWPDAKRRDLSNVLKGVEDALNGVLWGDDSQIDELRVYGKIDREKPRAFGSVSTLDLPSQPHRKAEEESR